MEKLYVILADLHGSIDLEFITARSQRQAELLAYKMYSDWIDKTLVVKKVDEVGGYEIILKPKNNLFLKSKFGGGEIENAIRKI